MALSSRRRTRRTTDHWPGFVDALAQLLIIIIFVLMVFSLAQFFLGQMLSGREAALERLTRRVSELTDLLAIERAANEDMRLNVEQLTAQLTDANAQIENLQATLRQTAEETARLDRQLTAAQADVAAAEDEAAALRERLGMTEEERRQALEQAATARQRAELSEQEKAEAEQRIQDQLRQIALLQQDIKALQALKEDLTRQAQEMAARLEETEQKLVGEEELSLEARAHAALLEQQIERLQQELARINDLLEAAEARNEEQRVQIADLGRRLNQALASKVQELQRYRSEFFGRLREILGDREGIRIEGDRFVFQSEILFGSGSATLGLAGEDELNKLADAITQIADEIPEDIDWILRVDGHTDRRPIRTARFENNWDLSTARATTVVEYLIDQGVPPQRLAAAGFGEHQPITDGETPEAMARNRRIELKLDQR
ncbi:Flagellar motor rotation protein MotB [Caenispirillum salinarum AK4]|uniref:Flagellar motor rotation protein MotB n=1 Tax=Caenispirillum salinarum AK4 TaxID=1238182 RepID=K9H1I4_9PROT|nr:peptidoglycan -binding protein [Caenispirillum salinarum]EKV31427.1 Flagellar motor rotation protein MotB [Caenispirillum salinarum AK4]